MEKNKNNPIKVLLVWPKHPDTFWSFKHALKFIFKKAAYPPLGLLTVAALLPKEWEKKLIYMNVVSLSDGDLKWANLVFIGAISVQKESAKEIIARCKKMGVKIVAGGPLFTTEHEEFDGVDYLVLNEAEITLPRFLDDFKNGCARHIYSSGYWADMGKSPIPLWELVNMKKYSSASIQYSRGCPFHCEFCDITLLYGGKQRAKDKNQIIAELENLYLRGWREGIFFVDDNFIGNKEKLKKEILPAIVRWMEKKKYPFSFLTQASINLSDDEKLMRLMVRAGFDTVFIGIESPNEESLTECAKFQNKNRDLIACVKKIQKFGLQVQGGFIVGFDSDTVSIFEKQIEFIQKSGIVTAMVGLLNVLQNTKLYYRLKNENRLLKNSSGNNTDYSINFIPKMSCEQLMGGYKKILSTIYSPRCYYERVRTFLKEYKPLRKKKFRFRFNYLNAFFVSIWRLGIVGKESAYYWRLIFWSLFRRPRLFPLAVTFAIYGFHFRKIFEKH